MKRLSKYRYREVKNYIHNELKLTKDDIKDIMVPIVKEEVNVSSITPMGTMLI